ncbi:MAG: ribokinase [Spirochaetaceae bacterium]|nr:MAG: ribokinase [Spirochaetaceae bacterium]
MARFCVIGSLNMDLVATVERFPRPGESLVGTGFATYTGGKGANQAIALARLGAEVDMIGRVGNDPFGVQYREKLAAEKVAYDAVESADAQPTGVALIEVEAGGENRIVWVPGANLTVDNSYIDRHRQRISSADFALLQLEIPLDATEYALQSAQQAGCVTILDPAPAQQLPRSLLSAIDYLTPNAGEAELLSGIEVSDSRSARAAAEALVQLGARSVVIKAGQRGAFVLHDRQFDHVAGYTIDAVDTTAAGDAFNAGLAFALGRGDTLLQAVRYANAVGALACRGAGAQAAMPGAAAVRDFIEQQK